jgi:hypothetical protein
MKNNYPKSIPCVGVGCNRSATLDRRGYKSQNRRYWLLRCEPCHAIIVWHRGLKLLLADYYKKSPELIIILGEKNV